MSSDKELFDRRCSELKQFAEKVTVKLNKDSPESQEFQNSILAYTNNIIWYASELLELKRPLSYEEQKRFSTEDPQKNQDNLTQHQNFLEEKLAENARGILFYLNTHPENIFPILQRPQLATLLYDFGCSLSDMGISSALPDNFFSVTKQAKDPKKGPHKT